MLKKIVSVYPVSAQAGTGGQGYEKKGNREGREKSQQSRTRAFSQWDTPGPHGRYQRGSPTWHILQPRQPNQS
jgi:hypothetical protein